MNETRLTVAGEPKSKQRARFSTRNGKISVYTPRETVSAEAAYADAYRAARTVDTSSDNQHGYVVHADFYAATRQRRDVDNMLKAVLDGLNAVAWADDRQVVEIVGRKHFVPKGQARTEVMVRQVQRLDLVETRPCDGCGTQLKTYPSWSGSKRYCNPECRQTSTGKTLTPLAPVECPGCGVTFTPKRANSRYCTRICGRRAAARDGRVEAICSVCSTVFTRQRCHDDRVAACSAACRGVLLKAKQVKVKAGTCLMCGAGTSRKEYTRCAACRHEGAGAAGAPIIQDPITTPHLKWSKP